MKCGGNDTDQYDTSKREMPFSWDIEFWTFGLLERLFVVFYYSLCLDEPLVCYHYWIVIVIGSVCSNTIA